ncbi:MAG: NADH-quinone oxidoreductase subunit NuoF [Anaerolineae bacterium]
MSAIYRAHVLVCGGTGCTASGSIEVAEALRKEIERRGLQDEVRIQPTGCRGFCAMGPVMIIYPEGTFYCQVRAEDVPELVEETLVKGRIVERLTYHEPHTHRALPHYSDIPFYRKQVRVALRNCGLINPEEIEEYIARDGYQALAKVLTEMTPEQVIDEVKRSGLRGRGGAGFLTGLKWEFAKTAKGAKKYIICNADEGDPGAFMDRSILEGDPHGVVEGMLIAAYAIGADEGYIYCRAEYPLAIRRLRTAIAQAEEYGLLGDGILGRDFSFHLHIKEGAGAFVCGEETALMASIEGRRGEPRPRPPFPAVSGLWGCPTNINNVETWANVPVIINRGADWFASIGTARSKGTKVFALTGKVNNTGLVEVPMGISLGEIIFDIGGGIPKGKEFKAVQTGGPLGGCLPSSQLNTPIDYDSLTAAGATMGSGGMIVVDEDMCMVELARFFLTFASAESCGKCVPCRVGGQRMLEILVRITEGRGTEDDLAMLEAIAEEMKDASLCALGQLTPSPVMSTMRYFRDEYLTHIRDRRCPTGTCKVLTKSRCISACPAGIDIPAYITLTSQGQYDAALEVHRERNPFALACGRVCPAFCEQRCRRGDVDEPVGIRLAKRFMADNALEKEWVPPRLGEDKDEKVAVVGAGPAGLTAALRLAQFGYKVTVFEALPVPGGMMAVGIPEYRLPKDVLQAEIANIVRAGVEIRCNQRLGTDFSLDDLLERDGYDAVILAIGAHRERDLGLAEEGAMETYGAVPFLRKVSLGEPPRLAGRRVAVIGGGNAAIDSARTAWRLGATEVHVVYRRDREDMPAYSEEIAAAEEEGVVFHYLANPNACRLTEDGRVGLECVAQKLGEFDASGRRRPEPIPGGEFLLDVDVVIAAIGQSPDTEELAKTDGLKTGRTGTITVNEAHLTSRPRVFAAGDAVSGPASVVEAVAQGNQVAAIVDHFLRTGEVARVRYETEYHFPEAAWQVDDYSEATRPKPRLLPVALRRGNFGEVEQLWEEWETQEECRRCLRCDLEWAEMMEARELEQEQDAVLELAL